MPCTTTGSHSNSFRDDQFLNLKPKNDGYVWRDLKGCVYQYKFHKPIVIKKSNNSCTSYRHIQQEMKMVQTTRRTNLVHAAPRPKIVLEAVVEYEYKAEQEDELTLKVGDIIKNVQTAEGGWWEGELNGKKGMFPENFVKLVKKRENTKKEGKREAAQRKSVRELANKFKDGVPMGGMAPKKKEKKKYCKVLFDYKKENDDELELTVGGLVEFLTEVEEGWWEGTLNGKHGVFPSNFVEMVEETVPAVEESAPPPVEEKAVQGGGDSKDADFQEIKGKKVTGFGLGNIFSGGPIKLRSTGGSTMDESGKEPPAKEAVKASKPSEPEPTPDVAKRERQTERAIVRYSYAADQPDELSLDEGQTVRIIDKELEDDGWWKGEVNGRVGVFPDNFVELLPPEEISKPKKPPPPSSSKQNVQQPKLPEKAVISNPSEDRVKPDTTSSSVRKPPGPPPIGKKPGFQKPEIQASKPDPVAVPNRPGSTGKPKETHNDVSNEDKDGSFDTIEPAAQKLTHLAANRPKGPAKRPPSTVLIFNEDKEVKIADEMKTSQVIDKPLPALPAKETKPTSNHLESSAPSHHVVSSQSQRDVHSSQAPPRPLETSDKAHTSQTNSGPNLHTTRLLEQLQQELNELKANAVSKAAFNELRSEHEKLKQDFENNKTSHSKKLRQLMNEVDEEKKLRLSTEVEIERVKKLLAESHV